LLIDTTATAHLPGPQNPGECHLYFAEGCHLYIALTKKCRGIDVTENRRPGDTQLFAAPRNVARRVSWRARRHLI
jgi:hypothetical protein